MTRGCVEDSVDSAHVARFQQDSFCKKVSHGSWPREDNTLRLWPQRNESWNYRVTKAECSILKNTTTIAASPRLSSETWRPLASAPCRFPRREELPRRGHRRHVVYLEAVHRGQRRRLALRRVAPLRQYLADHVLRVVHRLLFAVAPVAFAVLARALIAVGPGTLAEQLDLLSKGGLAPPLR